LPRALRDHLRQRLPPWRSVATRMSRGFVDLRVRRDVPRVVAALLALNEHLGEFSIGCRPSYVQLINRGSGHLRMLVLVDEADAEWIFKKGWVREYTTKQQQEPVLFGVSMHTCAGLGAVATALHTAEFLGSVMERLGLGNAATLVRGDWGTLQLATARWVFATNHDFWVRPLTDEQREWLFRHAETLQVHLASASAPEPVPESAEKYSTDFPELGKSPCSSPECTPPSRAWYGRGKATVTAVQGEDAHCDPATPIINEVDKVRLFQVAFLGADTHFKAPEALWLTGPSPSELRARHALI